MNTSLKGFNNQLATFSCTQVNEGDFVKLSANNCVTKCSAGDVFIGIAQSVRGNICSVLLKGYAEANYTGTLALGRKELVLDSVNVVESASTSGSGVEVIVVNVNSTTNTAGFIL